MANTYTQIHIHAVFAVRRRQALIDEAWKAKLYAYITGIIQSYGHKVIIINGTADHIHILFGMRPTQSLSDLMKEVKASSSKWINTNAFLKYRFEWQEGFGAFSYEMNKIPVVINYIKDQEKLHLDKPFVDEYQELLKQFAVSFDERYVFKNLIDH